ncbi:hypothetical protein BDZ91DRAFT_721009 [Kalaharituber pfeilii]|nr:hypothetical protein BDZ91DRAFT_721009 [Kalaharituber pfeilii]
MAGKGSKSRKKGSGKSTDTARGLGFHDEGIPPNLYAYWRRDLGRLMILHDCRGPAYSGTKDWEPFLEVAWNLPTLAPRARHMIRHDPEMQALHAALASDVAKKIRNGDKIAKRVSEEADKVWMNGRKKNKQTPPSAGSGSASPSSPLASSESSPAPSSVSSPAPSASLPVPASASLPAPPSASLPVTPSASLPVPPSASLPVTPSASPSPS